MARCEICGKPAGFMVDVCSACVEAKKAGKPLPENKAWLLAQGWRRKGLWLGGAAGAVVGLTAVSIQGNLSAPEGAIDAGKSAGLGALVGWVVGRGIGWWNMRKGAES